jgi:hypothetical protein
MSQTTTTSASTASPFVLPKASKRKRVEAFKEHIATNPGIVLDQSGEPLTDDHYFCGLLRTPVGLKSPVNRKLLNADIVLSSKLREGVKTLKSQATNWDVTYYKTASQHLYVLLASTYELLSSLNAHETNLNKLREAVTTFADKQKVKYKSSTPLISILISCVFKDIPSQRRCAYGLGLQAIIGIHGLTLSTKKVIDIITQAGGIYELARPYPELDVNDKTDNLNKPNSKFYLNSLKSNELYKFSDQKFAGLLAKTNTQYLVVISKDAKEKLTVNAVAESDSALLRIGKEVVENKKSAKLKLEKVSKQEAELAHFLLEPAKQELVEAA